MRALTTFLFTITLLELFLGAGGRVFELGSITFRMILFTVNLTLVSVLWIYRRKIPYYVLVLCVSLFFVFLMYGLLGLLNGANIDLILEDIRPLLYFLCIVFFAFYIDSKHRIEHLVSLVKKSSLFMAISYLAIQMLIYFGKIDFNSFYNYVNVEISSSDFIFRGAQGLFFYKGFMYMVIGLIFWIQSPKSLISSLAIFVLAIAMILTGTRGFILIFGLLYAIFYGVPLLLKLNLKMLILASVLIFGSLFFFANFDIGNKELSDSIRIKQVVEVIADIDFFSFFIGHGFGNGIPIRPIHMEIGYLEVFHKQGVLGLGLWGLFFTYIFFAYRRGTNNLPLRKGFLLSTLFVILLSFTNPYFNNPLGISMFILSLVSLKVLNQANSPKMGEKIQNV